MDSPTRASAGPITRSLGLVLTGGTVGSELTTQNDERVVKLKNDTVQPGVQSEMALLESSWEEASRIDFLVRRPLTLLSEDLAPSDWIKIAQASRELISAGVDGILVLHGTDTMTYTAAALSFLLHDIQAPVVLTGSNLPPEQPDSDATKNIHDALLSLQNLGPGTYVTFAGESRLPGWVHLGTCVRKTRACGQAFVSVNREPVAKISGDSFSFIEPWMPSVNPIERNASLVAIDDNVLSFRLYPGIKLDVFHSIVRTSDIRGVVIELYPSGTGPVSHRIMSMPDFVESCVSSGVTVVACLHAAPTGIISSYESTVELRNKGAIFLPDMLPETATVKLMWALAQDGNKASVAELLTTPVAGEIRN